MSEYKVCDPNDVRNLQGKRFAYKRIGAAVVRPATDAERAQFAPLHAALERQSRALAAAWWEVKLARQKAVGK